MNGNGLLADFQRRVAGLVTLGVVTEVAGDMVRVQVGKNFTPMIPFMVMRAGKVKVYCRPAVGEQVVVFSSSGDFQNAIAGPSLFCDRFGSPGETDGILIDAGGGKVRVDSEGVTIEAATVKVVGNVDVQGSVSASGDMTAGGVSLKEHVHGGVESGSGTTQKPQ